MSQKDIESSFETPCDPIIEKKKEKKKKFPLANTIILCLLIVAQIVCVIQIVFYRPKPQDVIEDYTIYVKPQNDGSLDIWYFFTWTALDPKEDLTWVEIGMANEYFTILGEHSDNISRTEKYVDSEGYCSAKIYFKQAYKGGSTVKFDFKVRQERILSTDGSEVFYEFIPGWFNYTEVKNYSFNFYKYGDISSFNGDDQNNNWLIWNGSLGCGYFVRMRVNYNNFDAHTVKYKRFNGDGVYDGLSSDKSSSTAAMMFIIIIIVIAEIHIIDCYVSYVRGRGFLRGYGHSMHTHGRINPHYRSAAAKHQSSGRGGGGRGCACACACACAGGGRAGCSQKDTYTLPKRKADK